MSQSEICKLESKNQSKYHAVSIEGSYNCVLRACNSYLDPFCYKKKRMAHHRFHDLASMNTGLDIIANPIHGYNYSSDRLCIAFSIE